MRRGAGDPRNAAARLASATGLARAFAGLPDMDVVLDPDGAPRFEPAQPGRARPRVCLPALPGDGLSAEDMQKLRAWLYHEACGEAAHNTWLAPMVAAARRGEAMPGEALRGVCNGLGDAILDATVADERPGAGSIIKAQVRADAQRMLREGCEPSVAALPAALRYLSERVLTRAELESALPAWGDVLQRLDDAGVLREALDAVDARAQDRLAGIAQRILDAVGYEDEAQDGQQPGQQGAQGGEQQQAGEQGEGEPSDGEGNAQAGEQQGEQAQQGSAGQGQQPAEGEERGGAGERGAPTGRGVGTGGAGQPLPTGDLAHMRTMEQRSAEELGKALREAAAASPQGWTDREPIVYPPTDRTREPLPVDGALSSALTNRLRAALEGHAPEPRDCQPRGRLDARRLHAWRSGNGRVFTRRMMGHKRDAAVGLLVDVSGSMAGREMDIVRELVPAWLDALDRLHVASALTTFSTRSYYVKRFSEPLAPVWPRLDLHLRPQENTDIAPAFFHLLTDLLARPEEHKVIVALSDGGVSDPGAQWDLLNIAHAAGVATMMLGIRMQVDPTHYSDKRRAMMEANPDGYARAYGNDIPLRWPQTGQWGRRWIYVPDAAALRGAAGRALTAALRDAVRGKV